MPKYIKYLSLILVCCCCFLFGACSNVGFGVYIYTNGNIAQLYSVELNETELQNLNINKDELLNKIQELATQHWETQKAGKDLTYVVYEPETTQNSFIAKITFKNINAYNDFYNIDPNNATAPEVEENLFFNKRIIFNGNSPYVNIESTTLYNELLTFIADNYFSGNTDAALNYIKDINVSTSRIYPTSYKIKTNADYHKVVSEYDIFVWQSTLEKELSSTPQNIKMWQTTFSTKNRIAWYGLGILLTVIFGAILFITLTIKHKRNNQKITNTQAPVALTQLPPKIAEIYNPEDANPAQKGNKD